MKETGKVGVTEGNPFFGTGGMKCPAAGTAANEGGWRMAA